MSAFEFDSCLPGLVDAIKAVSGKQHLDRHGRVKGTQRVWGYVVNVHMDPEKDKELYGTVDVQEYNAEPPEGFHEGVYLAAIQNNKSGYITVPCEYSDVMIAQDPASMIEYVVMVSHVENIQMRSHKDVEIGVVETEEFVEGDEGDDIPDLKETGNSATTIYNKEKILHTVKTKDGETTISQDAEKVIITAKDSIVTIKTDGTMTIKTKNISIESDDKVTLSSKDVTIEGKKSLSITTNDKMTINGKDVEMTGSKLTRKGKANTDSLGPFCGIPVCPFTGAPHTGSVVS